MDKIMSKKGKKYFLKMVAAILVVFLLFQEVSQAVSEGSFPSERVVRPGVSEVPIQSKVLEGIFSKLNLPEKFGKVGTVHIGSSKKVIIHIQDLHINQETQLQIANLIDHISLRYGTKLIQVEGASGELRHQLLSGYPNPKARELTARALLKEGLLTGPEYLAVSKKAGLVLFGVEDKKLYEDNRKALNEAMVLGQTLAKPFFELEKQVWKLINASNSQVSRDWLKNKDSFEQNGESILEYARFLYGLCRKENIKMRTPQMDQLFRLEKVENEIRNQKRYSTERELQRVLEKSLKEARGVDAGIFDEIKMLETLLKEKKIKDGDVQKLYQVYDILSVYKKMLSLALTRENVEFLYSYRSEFEPENLKQALNELAGKFQLQLDYQAIPFDQFQKALQAYENFYKIALARDESLFQGAIQSMERYHENTSILVTGGFHTAAIEKQLIESGVSFCTITPSIKEKINARKDQRLYLKAMKMQSTPLKPMMKSVNDFSLQLQVESRLPTSDNFQSAYAQRPLSSLVLSDQKLENLIYMMFNLIGTDFRTRFNKPFVGSRNVFDSLPKSEHSFVEIYRQIHRGNLKSGDETQGKVLVPYREDFGFGFLMTWRPSSPLAKPRENKWAKTFTFVSEDGFTLEVKLLDSSLSRIEERKIKDQKKLKSFARSEVRLVDSKTLRDGAVQTDLMKEVQAIVKDEENEPVEQALVNNEKTTNGKAASSSESIDFKSLGIASVMLGVFFAIFPFTIGMAISALILFRFAISFQKLTNEWGHLLVGATAYPEIITKTNFLGNRSVSGWARDILLFQKFSRAPYIDIPQLAQKAEELSQAMEALKAETDKDSAAFNKSKDEITDFLRLDNSIRYGGWLMGVMLNIIFLSLGIPLLISLAPTPGMIVLPIALGSVGGLATAFTSDFLSLRVPGLYNCGIGWIRIQRRPDDSQFVYPDAMQKKLYRLLRYMSLYGSHGMGAAIQVQQPKTGQMTYIHFKMPNGAFQNPVTYKRMGRTAMVRAFLERFEEAVLEAENKGLVPVGGSLKLLLHVRLKTSKGKLTFETTQPFSLKTKFKYLVWRNRDGLMESSEEEYEAYTAANGDFQKARIPSHKVLEIAARNPYDSVLSQAAKYHKPEDVFYGESDWGRFFSHIYGVTVGDNDSEKLGWLLYFLRTKGLLTNSFLMAYVFVINKSLSLKVPARSKLQDWERRLAPIIRSSGSHNWLEDSQTFSQIIEEIQQLIPKSEIDALALPEVKVSEEDYIQFIRTALIAFQNNHPELAGKIAMTMVNSSTTVGSFFNNSFEPDEVLLLCREQPVAGIRNFRTGEYIGGSNLDFIKWTLKERGDEADELAYRDKDPVKSFTLIQRKKSDNFGGEIGLTNLNTGNLRIYSMIEDKQLSEDEAAKRWKDRTHESPQWRPPQVSKTPITQDVLSTLYISDKSQEEFDPILDWADDLEKRENLDHSRVAANGNGHIESVGSAAASVERELENLTSRVNQESATVLGSEKFLERWIQNAELYSRSAKALQESGIRNPGPIGAPDLQLVVFRSENLQVAYWFQSLMKKTFPLARIEVINANDYIRYLEEHESDDKTNTFFMDLGANFGPIQSADEHFRRYEQNPGEADDAWMEEIKLAIRDPAVITPTMTVLKQIYDRRAPYSFVLTPVEESNISRALPPDRFSAIPTQFYPEVDGGLAVPWSQIVTLLHLYEYTIKGMRAHFGSVETPLGMEIGAEDIDLLSQNIDYSITEGLKDVLGHEINPESGLVREAPSDTSKGIDMLSTKISGHISEQARSVFWSVLHIVLTVGVFSTIIRLAVSLLTLSFGPVYGIPSLVLSNIASLFLEVPLYVFFPFMVVLAIRKKEKREPLYRNQIPTVVFTDKDWDELLAVAFRKMFGLAKGIITPNVLNSDQYTKLEGELGSGVVRGTIVIFPSPPSMEGSYGVNAEYEATPLLASQTASFSSIEAVGGVMVLIGDSEPDSSEDKSAGFDYAVSIFQRKRHELQDENRYNNPGLAGKLLDAAVNSPLRLASQYNLAMQVAIKAQKVKVVYDLTTDIGDNLDTIVTTTQTIRPAPTSWVKGKEWLTNHINNAARSSEKKMVKGKPKSTAESDWAILENGGSSKQERRAAEHNADSRNAGRPQLNWRKAENNNRSEIRVLRKQLPDLESLEPRGLPSGSTFEDSAVGLGGKPGDFVANPLEGAVVISVQPKEKAITQSQTQETPLILATQNIEVEEDGDVIQASIHYKLRGTEYKATVSNFKYNESGRPEEFTYVEERLGTDRFESLTGRFVRYDDSGRPTVGTVSAKGISARIFFDYSDMIGNSKIGIISHIEFLRQDEKVVLRIESDSEDMLFIYESSRGGQMRFDNDQKPPVASKNAEGLEDAVVVAKNIVQSDAGGKILQNMTHYSIGADSFEALITYQYDKNGKPVSFRFSESQVGEELHFLDGFFTKYEGNRVLQGEVVDKESGVRIIFDFSYPEQLYETLVGVVTKFTSISSEGERLVIDIDDDRLVFENAKETISLAQGTVFLRDRKIVKTNLSYQIGKQSFQGILTYFYDKKGKPSLFEFQQKDRNNSDSETIYGVFAEDDFDEAGQIQKAEIAGESGTKLTFKFSYPERVENFPLGIISRIISAFSDGDVLILETDDAVNYIVEQTVDPNEPGDMSDPGIPGAPDIIQPIPFPKRPPVPALEQKKTFHAPSIPPPDPRKTLEPRRSIVVGNDSDPGDIGLSVGAALEILAQGDELQKRMDEQTEALRKQREEQALAEELRAVEEEKNGAASESDAIKNQGSEQQVPPHETAPDAQPESTPANSNSNEAEEGALEAGDSMSFIAPTVGIGAMAIVAGATSLNRNRGDEEEEEEIEPELNWEDNGFTLFIPETFSIQLFNQEERVSSIYFEEVGGLTFQAFAGQLTALMNSEGMTIKISDESAYYFVGTENGKELFIPASTDRENLGVPTSQISKTLATSAQGKRNPSNRLSKFFVISAVSGIVLLASYLVVYGNTIKKESVEVDRADAVVQNGMMNFDFPSDYSYGLFLAGTVIGIFIMLKMANLIIGHLSKKKAWTAHALLAGVLLSLVHIPLWNQAATAFFLAQLIWGFYAAFAVGLLVVFSGWSLFVLIKSFYSMARGNRFSSALRKDFVKAVLGLTLIGVFGELIHQTREKQRGAPEQHLSQLSKLFRTKTFPKDERPATTPVQPEKPQAELEIDLPETLDLSFDHVAPLLSEKEDQATDTSKTDYSPNIAVPIHSPAEGSKVIVSKKFNQGASWETEGIAIPVVGGAEMLELQQPKESADAESNQTLSKHYGDIVRDYSNSSKETRSSIVLRELKEIEPLIRAYESNQRLNAYAVLKVPLPDGEEGIVLPYQRSLGNPKPGQILGYVHSKKRMTVRVKLPIGVWQYYEFAQLKVSVDGTKVRVVKVALEPQKDGMVATFSLWSPSKNIFDWDHKAVPSQPQKAKLDFQFKKRDLSTVHPVTAAKKAGAGKQAKSLPTVYTVLGKHKEQEVNPPQEPGRIQFEVRESDWAQPFIAGVSERDQKALNELLAALRKKEESVKARIEVFRKEMKAGRLISAPAQLSDMTEFLALIQKTRARALTLHSFKPKNGIVVGVFNSNHQAPVAGQPIAMIITPQISGNPMVSKNIKLNDIVELQRLGTPDKVYGIVSSPTDAVSNTQGQKQNPSSNQQLVVIFECLPQAWLGNGEPVKINFAADSSDETDFKIAYLKQKTKFNEVYGQSPSTRQQIFHLEFRMPEDREARLRVMRTMEVLDPKSIFKAQEKDKHNLAPELRRERENLPDLLATGIDPKVLGIISVMEGEDRRYLLRQFLADPLTVVETKQYRDFILYGQPDVAQRILKELAGEKNRIKDLIAFYYELNNVRGPESNITRLAAALILDQTKKESVWALLIQDKTFRQQVENFFFTMMTSTEKPEWDPDLSKSIRRFIGDSGFYPTAKDRVEAGERIGLNRSLRSQLEQITHDRITSLEEPELHPEYGPVLEAVGDDFLTGHDRVSKAASVVADQRIKHAASLFEISAFIKIAHQTAVELGEQERHARDTYALKAWDPFGYMLIDAQRNDYAQDGDVLTGPFALAGFDYLKQRLNAELFGTALSELQKLKSPAQPEGNNAPTEAEKKALARIKVLEEDGAITIYPFIPRSQGGQLNRDHELIELEEGAQINDGYIAALDAEGLERLLEIASQQRSESGKRLEQILKQIFKNPSIEHILGLSRWLIKENNSQAIRIFLNKHGDEEIVATLRAATPEDAKIIESSTENKEGAKIHLDPADLLVLQQAVAKLISLKDADSPHLSIDKLKALMQLFQTLPLYDLQTLSPEPIDEKTRASQTLETIKKVKMRELAKHPLIKFLMDSGFEEIDLLEQIAEERRNDKALAWAIHLLRDLSTTSRFSYRYAPESSLLADLNNALNIPTHDPERIKNGFSRIALQYPDYIRHLNEFEQSRLRQVEKGSEREFVGHLRALQASTFVSLFIIAGLLGIVSGGFFLFIAPGKKDNGTFDLIETNKEEKSRSEVRQESSLLEALDSKQQVLNRIRVDQELESILDEIEILRLRKINFGISTVQANQELTVQIGSEVSNILNGENFDRAEVEDDGLTVYEWQKDKSLSVQLGWMKVLALQMPANHQLQIVVDPSLKETVYHPLNEWLKVQTKTLGKNQSVSVQYETLKNWVGLKEKSKALSGLDWAAVSGVSALLRTPQTLRESMDILRSSVARGLARTGYVTLIGPDNFNSRVVPSNIQRIEIADILQRIQASRRTEISA